jgi:hypothetical protein
MSKKTSNLLLLGFLGAFFFIGFLALQKAMPEEKNEALYAQLKPHLPYKVEKSLNGFTIIDKKTGEKTKPPASEALKHMDTLDKQWGKEFLKLQGNELSILNSDKQPIKTIVLNQEQTKWVKSFFGI